MSIYLTAFLAAATLVSQGADKRALIAKALTEPTHISLENIRLVDAICKITDQTGVRIEMSPEAMKYVPQGPETIIQKVSIANVPLSEGLARLFHPLGMKFEVVEDHVRIVPTDALLCLGRAPTWKELQVLSELTASQPGLKSEDLDDLQDRMQFKVPSPDPWGSLSQIMRNVGAGSGDEVLTVATAQLGWTWCLSDERIVVGTFEQMLRQRLRQRISLKLNNRPMIEVLQAIGSEVDIPVRTEPGALVNLPPQMRNYSINAVHLPAEQVLEAVAANAGLGYLLSQEGIVFFNPQGPDSSRQTAAPTGSPDPYVGKIIIDLGDGKTFEWMIRRSELPDDLKQIRDNDIGRAIDEIRQRRLSGGPQ